MARRPLRRFNATMEALTPVRCFVTERRARVWNDSAGAPGLHLECLMDRPNSRRPPCLSSAHRYPCFTNTAVLTIPSPTTLSSPAVALPSYMLPLSATDLQRAFQLSNTGVLPTRVQASPSNRRLAETPGRNGFVILRTGRSPPVASHAASRRLQLQSVTGCSADLKRTCTSLTICARRRTIPAFAAMANRRVRSEVIG